MSVIGLIRIAVASEVVALLFFAATHADRDAAALAVVSAIGLGLLAWRRIVGLVLLGFLFADVSLFTATAAVSAAQYADGLGPVALQCSLAAISLVGLAAIFLALIRRPSVRRPIGVSLAAVAILAAFASVGSAGTAVVAASSSGASTLRIATKDTAYSTRELVAHPGEITVDMSNADLFWHTFTIEALGVDLRVPLAGRRSVSFTVAPGVYQYRCGIPGHDSAGMTGTLTVR